MRTAATAFGMAAILAVAIVPGMARAASNCAGETFDSLTPPALPVGWVSSVTLGAANGTGWVSKSVGYTSSAPNALWLDDRDDYADISLTSPSYAAPAAAPAFSFRQSYDLWAPQPGTQYNGAYNGAVLELSINAAAFVDIVSAGGTITATPYSQSLDPDFDNPLGQSAPYNRAVWSGAISSFSTVRVTLPTAASGSSVRLRWRFGSAGGGRAFSTRAGWWIDNLEIQGLGDVIFRYGMETPVPCNS